MWRRFNRSLALGLGLGLAGAQTGVNAADSIPVWIVVLDQSKIARIADGTETLIVGNPAVADVITLKSPGTMVVTAKGLDETNLIALDAKGKLLDQKIVRVASTTAAMVIIHGMQRESCSCAPKCMPAGQLGGDGVSVKAPSAQAAEKPASEK